MLEVEVSRSGLELTVFSDKFSGPLRQKLIKRLADVAWAEAFWGAPRRTGYLASTVYKDVGEGEARVGAAASYARHVEYGTRPHEIRPVNASVLVFQGRNGLVFTPLVHHPGTKANPFMHRAAEKTVGSVSEVFSGLWLELVSG
jgi:HK97 gp10 family phage protein